MLGGVSHDKVQASLTLLASLFERSRDWSGQNIAWPTGKSIAPVGTYRSGARWEFRSCKMAAPRWVLIFPPSASRQLYVAARERVSAFVGAGMATCGALGEDEAAHVQLNFSASPR